ncbi:hypothetical protein CHARACLAT_008158, partial [Characodon lateralis]|nr:hypothetical protein [Characodon lateralis]
WVTGKLVPISNSLWAGGGVHPGQVANPLQVNTQTTMQTPKGNLERAINLTRMPLDCGRKYPERTRAYTRRSRTQDLLPARQQCYQLRHHAARCQHVSKEVLILGACVMTGVG